MYATPDIKRALLLHDLSGLGRCSLSVAVPVLSVLGVQCISVPTALLSTHTGGYEGYTFRDLTDELAGALRHYDEMGLEPDIIYTGFLGSEPQIDIIRAYLRGKRWRRPLILVDPVMGDDGKLYATYDEGMRQGMAELASCADIITPNLTEACLLTGEAYPARCGRDFTEKLHTKLARMAGTAVITGIAVEGGYGASYAESRDPEPPEVAYDLHERIEGDYPGCGDIFAAILCASTARGIPLGDSVRCANAFLQKAIRITKEKNTPVREGLIYEHLLPSLAADINDYEKSK